MAAALDLLLIGWLLQSALCGQFEVTVPQTIEVLRGSCVTIPCSFDVENKYESNLDKTCKALWKNDQDTVVFNSSAPEQTTIKGELTGDLTRKDCTTTLNNMQPEHSKKYFFRVQCNNVLRHNFPDQKLEISVKDGPPTPTLTPSTLKVKEGTSVNVTCSAPAPCLSHPPTLTWTPSLGDIHETLQENQDKTKFKTSVLTFTASHLHHRQEISCTAVYNKQDGSTESSVTTRLTADILFAPQILPSSDCTKSAGQFNCSCESVGKPSPILQWYLDGFPVNNSDKFAISNETVNDTSLRSFINVSDPQGRGVPTLLCHSSNSLGSATQRFYVYILQPYDLVTLAVFITIVVILLVVVCALLLVIRAQKTRHYLLKSTLAMNQHVTSGEGIEGPKATEEDIYVNTAEPWFWK
ncbi:myelin-associated glycoprotein-like [Micropterus dolomieu]|uniref:myelin-associated glycoprotein-like n=1 Tax=Micropterus dolomieu TaxID=147949 RepID=UPI001E8D0586|nr:myelin-associated glycoprotein-like [Micropterus dolomieu]XP_045901569.1 myelin-associated glycoprotein-like [Micropterus dolomieu]XP_045901570.1 myelin-associated glycoprotein-like [Micropterus dolomieu]